MEEKAQEFEAGMILQPEVPQAFPLLEVEQNSQTTVSSSFQLEHKEDDDEFESFDMNRFPRSFYNDEMENANEQNNNNNTLENTSSQQRRDPAYNVVTSENAGDRNDVTEENNGISNAEYV